MNASTKEKRRTTRVTFRAEAVLRTAAEEISAPADTRDISIQGLFLRTSPKPPVGALCDVDIRLTGSSSELVIHVKGRVVRHDEDGVAIAFEGVDFDSYFHLKNLLLYNAADPSAIERELPL